MNWLHPWRLAGYAFCGAQGFLLSYLSVPWWWSLLLIVLPAMGVVCHVIARQDEKVEEWKRLLAASLHQ